MRFLIVKTSSLGDLIHVFPTVEYLKDRYPDAEIDWVVERSFADLIRAHPLVAKTLPVDTRAWRKAFWKPTVWKEVAMFKALVQTKRYDAVFDLQGNIKSGCVTGLAKAKEKVGFSKETVPELPNLLFTTRRYAPPAGQNIRSDYLSIVQQHFGDRRPFKESGVRLIVSSEEREKINELLLAPALKRRPRVLVASGSMWPNKQLSLEALEVLLKLLKKETGAVFLLVWGSNEEKKMAEKLQKTLIDSSIVVDKMPLPVLQNLMAEMDLVIAMDSLPLHLAGTTGTTTFSVFGASLAAKYQPEGIRHVAVQGGCPYGRVFEKRCPLLRTCKTGLCIKGVDPNELFQELKKSLSFSLGE